MFFNGLTSTQQNLTMHYQSSSTFGHESNTLMTPAVANKRKELDKTANELEAQPINRIDAIIKAIFINSKLPNNIADLVILYDDPCDDIIRIMIQGKEIPKPVELLAKQVTTLNLSNQSITEQVTKLFKLFSSIDSLCTSQCEYAGVVTLHYLQALGLPQKLKSLDFSLNTSIHDEHLCTITQLTKLQSLNLNNCAHLTGKSIAVIAQLSTLQSLNLRNFNITGFEFSSLVQLQQLQDLNLQGCRGITDKDLTSIAKLTKLQRLNLSYCHMITDDGLVSLVQLKDLCSLDISGCINITDDGLDTLSELKELQYFNLKGCENITDKGIASLIELKKLQYLRLSNCPKITSDGLSDMLLGELENLQILLLDGCTKVKTSDIAVLTQATQDRQVQLKIEKYW